MKKKIIKRLYWRKLDDQAKVFTLASNKKYSSIYRLSVLLKEDIDDKLLQKATEMAITKYRAFKVRLKFGLFWYYVEENELMPIVSEEVDYPFKKINDKANNEYLFKVTYFHKKINLEVFHALTDGNGAILFLNDIIYRYLEMKYPNEIPAHKKEFRRMSEDTEDAYKKSYVKKRAKIKKIKRAYMLQGEELDKGEYGQKSYRRIDDNVDCNRIAMLHGGGGHVGSAAVSINESQNKKIKKMEKKKALDFIANSSYEVE